MKKYNKPTGLDLIQIEETYLSLVQRPNLKNFSRGLNLPKTGFNLSPA